MAFFSSAINILQTLVVAIGAGLGVWGVINLMEGYGNDNPGAKSQGIKQLMSGGGVILIGTQLIPLLSGLFGDVYKRQTVDRAQELGEQFCKEHFPGHQALVCTHPDGHNHSGNIHVHIVINSLRIYEVPLLPYMDLSLIHILSKRAVFSSSRQYAL